MRLHSLLSKILLGFSISFFGFLASCNEEDPNPVVSFSETSISFDESDGSVGIDVVLTRAASKDIVVKYSLSGSAKEGTAASSDYSIDNVGELAIAKGQTNATITLELNDDNVFEGNETITVTINDVDDGIDIGVENVAEIVITETDSEPPTTDGLIAYYDFEGNSVDKVGDFDGTDYVITYESADHGIESMVADFPGVESYIELPNPFDLERKTITFLVSAVKSNNGTRLIYSSDHATIVHGMTVIGVYQEASQLSLTYNFSNELKYVPIEAGTWYSVAVTLNGKNYAYYLDGVVVGSGVFDEYERSGNGVDVATIGCSRGYDRFFDGQLDEFRIYNRVLTADEIEYISTYR